jgi:hypothetical protein
VCSSDLPKTPKPQDCKINKYFIIIIKQYVSESFVLTIDVAEYSISSFYKKRFFNKSNFGAIKPIIEYVKFFNSKYESLINF